MPISGFLARMAAWWAGVPRIACTCHGFWFNNPGNPARRAVGLPDGVDCRARHHVFLTVSEEEARDARRCGSAATPSRCATAAIPRCSIPIRRRARIRNELGIPPGPDRDHRSLPAGAPQGLSRTGRRHARCSGRGTLGRGRTAALRPWRRHGEPCCATPGSVRDCGCWDIVPTSPRCWRRRISSCCPVISRDCRCR